MLILPYDAASSEAEWREWITQGSKFGVLAVPNHAGKAPVMVETHFSLLKDEIVLHLHHQNSALELMAEGAPVSLAVFSDYAYIENQWRAKDASQLQNGVPTSYYAAVNFSLKPTLIDDPNGIAEILKIQMEDLQASGGYAEISPETSPYGPMMNAIRGVRLQILEVEAKFKYDDHKTVEFRQNIAQKLVERNQKLDSAAAEQQLRRVDQIGEWY